MTAAKAKKKLKKAAVKAIKSARKPVSKKTSKPAKLAKPKAPAAKKTPPPAPKKPAVKAVASQPAKTPPPKPAKVEKTPSPVSSGKEAAGEPQAPEIFHNPYGASDEAVEDTGEALGVVFPKTVIRIWKAVNGAEINDWKFHPVREPSGSASKADIIMMNGDNRPEDLSDDFITIAEQDGNHLVLEKEDDRLLPDLLLWDRDSAEVDPYSEELENFAEEAEELRDELLASRRR